MILAADILIVLATVICGVSIAAIVAGWAARTWPVFSMIALAVGAGLFAYVHFQTGGLTWTDIPDAFILVAARILN
jgi:hypothetical protein